MLRSFARCMLLLGLMLLALGCTKSTPTAAPSTASPAVETARPTLEKPAGGEAPTALPPTPTPAPQPPALVESNPPAGSEIALDAPITLSFNQAMDRASVESAFSGQPALVGTFSWSDDRTVTFTPQSAFPPAAALLIRVAETARASNGMAMLSAASLSYQAVGYLQLAERLPPADAQEADPSSAVTAAFNRPVVPLGADPASLPAAFTLDPPANGRGEWVNTSTYIFYPQPALAGGVNYLVRLNPELKAADGAVFQAAEDWRFTTAMPALISTQPLKDMAGVLLDSPIQLTFNQPMDSGSVEKAFLLLDVNGAPVAGVSGWDERLTTFTFTPTQLLTRNQNYTFALNVGARSLGGSEMRDLPVAFPFTTAYGLSVWNTSIGQGSVALNILAPISPKVDPLDYITLYPPVSDLSAYVYPDYQYSNYPAAYVLRVSGSFTPETEYRLTLSPDLPDVWGGVLGDDIRGQAYVLPFRSPPLESSLFIPLGSETLFTTPADGGLPVQVVNLSSVGMMVGSIPLPDFIAMLGPNGYDYKMSFTPADAASWSQRFTGQERNDTNFVELPLREGGGALRPGLYQVRLSFTEPNLPPQTYLAAVSNLHLTFKLGAADALVWAVDTRTNQPAANAPVVLYAEDGSPLAIGTTDGQGLFSTTVPGVGDPYSTRYAVVGQPGDENFGIALSTWNTGVASWDFNLASDYDAPRDKNYIYTDRPVYRPGQTVYYRVIVRSPNLGGGALYTLPTAGRVKVNLYDDQGTLVTTYDLPLSALGAAHGSFALPGGARPGSYRIEAGADSLYFQVANYRKPEINLQASFLTAEVLSGTPLQATLLARYFFDAPAAGAKVHWSLYRQANTFDLPGYQVGLENTAWWMNWGDEMFGMYGSFVQEGEGQVGPDGFLVIDLPQEPVTEASVSPEAQDWRYQFEATVTDESGLSVSARASILVHPADFYIGIHTEASQGDRNFTVQTVGWDASPSGNRPLRAEFSKVTWTRTRPTDLYTPPTYQAVYTPVSAVDFNTGADGIARLTFTPPEPGVYRLEVSGGGARSQATFWVGGAGQAVWPDASNNRLSLTADQSSYRPGDTAKVFMPNPFGSALVLYTLERGSVIHSQTFPYEGPGMFLEIPLTADHAPNVYVSVTLIGRDENGYPDFRQGYLNLPVEPLAQTLKVSVTADPPRAGPGDVVNLKVHVTDANGAPVQGEFSLSVVDLAALALADPNAPDILPAFYGIQPLGVRSGHSLAAYSRRLTYFGGGRGGGGGGEMIVARENLPDTAFWQADLATDANGDAQVSVTLPDNLTTWQIEARGITADSRVGQAKIELVATKDLLIRSAAPRFVVEGDHLELAAVVQNNTAGDLQTEVALQAVGITLDDPGVMTQTVVIPAGGRLRLSWWGTVQTQSLPGGALDLTFVARAGDYSDALRVAGGALPVLHYAAPQTFATAGILSDSLERLELVSLPSTFLPLGGTLKVELASSLASATLQALDVLEHYPYECTEQTLSRFLPNLETYRTMQAFGVVTPDLQARLDRTLITGLTTLLARQNFDGGWSWWAAPSVSADGSLPSSDVFMTAYVFFGLGRAQSAGAPVNVEAIQRAAEFLLANLTPPDGSLSTDQLDRLAFVQFSLASMSLGDAAGPSALYDLRSQLSPWAQALLALTLEVYTPGSPQAATLIADLESSAVRSATGAHWDLSAGRAGANLGTPLTNSAVVIYALAQRNPTSALLPEAVRSLMAQRGADGAWGSTYETAWSLMALTQYMQASRELTGAFPFSALLNGQEIASGQAAADAAPVQVEIPLRMLYPADPNALLIQRQAGDGVLYYTAALNVIRPVEEAQPLNRGLNLERQYFLDDPRAGDQPLDSALAAPGQKLTVRLTLTLPHDAYYLVVEDYIPAGAEILDRSLKTSQQMSDPAAGNYQPDAPYANGWGWWLFSSPRIYDDHVAWAADYLPAGTYQLTYQMTALQAGQFRVLPAHAWQFYFPEVEGASAGTIFEIRP